MLCVRCCGRRRGFLGLPDPGHTPHWLAVCRCTALLIDTNFLRSWRGLRIEKHLFYAVKWYTYDHRSDRYGGRTVIDKLNKYDTSC